MMSEREPMKFRMVDFQHRI